MNSQEPIYFSIIIPVKWKGDYLAPALQSIAQQTYQHYEVIILLDKISVENGTVAWLQEQTIVPVRLEISDQELGIAENWARIKDIRKSTYMTIMGYDDIFYPTFLETMADEINQYPDAGVYHAHFDIIDASGEVFGQCKPMHRAYTPSAFMEAMICFSITQMATGYVFRSHDYDTVGGIPTHYPNIIYADIDLFLQLSLKGGVRVIPAQLFAFRWHLSTTRTSKIEALTAALNLFAAKLASWKKEVPAFTPAIEQNALHYLSKEYRSLAHSSLRLSLAERGHYTVKYFMQSLKTAYYQVYGKQLRFVMFNWGWLSALIIDTIPFVRAKFRKWRLSRKKPIMS